MIGLMLTRGSLLRSTIRPRIFCRQRRYLTLRIHTKAYSTDNKKQQILQKEETTIDKAIRNIKESNQTSLDSHQQQEILLPVKKLPLTTRIYNEIVHYWDGFKLLATETGISSRLLLKLVRGFKLSRREMTQLQRTTGDLLRLVPFIIIILIPFLELLLPVLIKLFPNMLPSTFESKFQAEEKMKKILKVRLEVAKFLQDTVGEMAIQGQSKNSKSAKEFVDFFNKWRINGDQAPTAEIIKIAKKFEDSLTLNSLSRPQLVSMCKYMNVNAFGTDVFLRTQIENRLAELKADDQLIAGEGVDSLTISELQMACQARGIRIVGISPARLRSELSQWIELNLNQKIPSSLLILSRAFTISERDSEEAMKGSAQALQATLSSLPEQVVNEAALKVAESEGVATSKQKLAVLKEQEELIDDELEQEAIQAGIQKAKQAELEELKKKAESLAEKVVVEKPVAVAPPQIENAGVYFATNEHESIIEFPDDKIEDEDLKIQEDEIKKIAEIVKTMSTDSALRDVKEKLDTLKEDSKELKEDLEELTQVTQTPTQKQTSALSSSLDKMLLRIEKELESFDSEIGSKLHILRPDDEGKLSLQELEDALKVIRDNPADERIKKIVKQLDTDGDGWVSLAEIAVLAENASKGEGYGIVVDKDRNKPGMNLASLTAKVNEATTRAHTDSCKK